MCGGCEELELVNMLFCRVHCQLYLFLHEYVERDFLERVRLEYFDKMSKMQSVSAEFHST